MNINKLLIVILLLSLISTACSGNRQATDKSEPARSVKTIEVKKEIFPIKMNYIGTVSSKDIKKYSFKSSAKIASINVETGEEIKKGTVLVNLDTNDLSLSVNAAKAQMDTAKAQYDKALNGAQQEDITTIELNVNQAQSSYQFASEQYENNIKLYETGGISQLQLDQSKLQMDNAKDILTQAKETLKKIQSGSRTEDISAAKSQYQAATINYEAQQNLLEDATLKSELDGYVVQILYKEGEMVPAGYPVVVVRSEIQTVSVGISQKDIKQINIGNKADITIDETTLGGVISNINQVPDEATLTYQVEVDLAEDTNSGNFYIGSIAKVQFTTQESEGIWIDIPIIMNDGQDYVYIVENEHAIKKIIEIGDIYESKVSVTGLEPGAQLIVEGISNIKDGYKVLIAN